MVEKATNIKAEIDGVVSESDYDRLKAFVQHVLSERSQNKLELSMVHANVVKLNENIVSLEAQSTRQLGKIDQ